MPTSRLRSLLAPLAAAACALALVAAACSDDDGGATPSTTAPSTSAAATTTTVPEGDGVTPEGISEERCAANQDAGTITYLSSFDFAAAASIVDVVLAAERGYFERLCLDVELRAGFSLTNYPLVAAGQAHFSSAGSFTELVENNTNDAELVALVDYGKTAVEALLVRADDPIQTLGDLRGKVIGVKGKLPPSLVAMLGQAGLHPGDWQEVLLDGYDPVAQLQTSIDALPVYKSNEPGQLDAAGIGYRLFDPLQNDIPGSFGLLYTSRALLEDHPTAAVDFVRAALAGFADAVADPDAAVDAAVARIDAAGNASGLTREGEAYRWAKESEIVAASTPDGEIPGLIDGDLLLSEVAAMVEAGVFDDPPGIAGTYDEAVARSVLGADGAPVMPRA